MEIRWELSRNRWETGLDWIEMKIFILIKTRENEKFSFHSNSNSKYFSILLPLPFSHSFSRIPEICCHSVSASFIFNFPQIFFEIASEFYNDRISAFRSFSSNFSISSSYWFNFILPLFYSTILNSFNSSNISELFH